VVKELESLVINWRAHWDITVQNLILAVRTLDEIEDILENKAGLDERTVIELAKHVITHHERGESR
jgi:hypothetical protein